MVGRNSETQIRVWEKTGEYQELSLQNQLFRPVSFSKQDYPGSWLMRDIWRKTTDIHNLNEIGVVFGTISVLEDYLNQRISGC